jgi:hypothetical protein
MRKSYDETLIGADGSSYWERNWQLFKQRSLSKQIPRKQRGELQPIVWEGNALRGLGILDGDIIVIMRTPDIEEGDLICTKDPEGEEFVNLGVLSFNTGDDYIALTFPGTKHRQVETHPCLLRFLGRAVRVERNGNPVAIHFRRVELTKVEIDSREIIETRMAA